MLELMKQIRIIVNDMYDDWNHEGYSSPEGISPVADATVGHLHDYHKDLIDAAPYLGKEAGTFYVPLITLAQLAVEEYEART